MCGFYALLLANATHARLSKFWLTETSVVVRQIHNPSGRALVKHLQWHPRGAL